MSELEINEHRQMLLDSVTHFARGLDLIRVRQLRDTATECDRAVWQQMAELGWLGVLVPEAYWGMALQLADMAIVAQALARVLLPEPLTAVAVLAASVLAQSNNEALKKTLLTDLVSGHCLPATAWQEQAGSLAVNSIGLQATAFEGGFKLNGRKQFVMGATGADGFIVSAQSQQTPGVDGVQLWWVPKDTAGASVSFETLADARRCATLSLKEVVVAKQQLLLSGQAAVDSLSRAIDHTAVILSAELCGLMSRALEMSLEYMKTRVQFGKPIGSFQALQHRAVDLYIQQELASAVLADGLSILDAEPTVQTRQAVASRVKARCTEAALLITRQSIQLHGAIGFTEDCDVGLYVKRAMCLAAWMGNAHTHRRRYAKTEILREVA